MQEQSQQTRMYLSGMWKYRWFGIAASWLVCTAIWTYVYYKPDVYEATGKIQVDMGALLKPKLKSSLVEPDQANIINILTNRLMSRPILERIIRETDLNLEASDKEKMQYLIEHLRESITLNYITPFYGGAMNYSIFTISFKDHKPNLAYAVVKKAIDILEENIQRENQTGTDSAHATLQNQIKEYENQLSTEEQKLANFKNKNSDFLPGQDGEFYNRLQTATEKLSKIESELKIARDKVKLLKLQLQQEAEHSVTASYDKQIKEHEDKLNSLLLQFTDNHPAVQAEKSIIASLEKRKKDAIGNASTVQPDNRNDDSMQMDKVYRNLQIALKEAEMNVSDIEASRVDQKRLIKMLQQQVAAVSDNEAQLSKLNRDYEISKLEYSEMMSRQNSNRISSQAFKVIEPPLVPNIPVGPNRLLLNLAAVMTGLAACFGVLFLILQLKPVFLTKNKLEHFTGLPVLGTVTMVQDAETIERHRKERTIIILLGFAQILVFAIIALLQK
jgi:polysaccharide chain length determinant protein (PEP-CTERM system associated)